MARTTSMLDEALLMWFRSRTPATSPIPDNTRLWVIRLSIAKIVSWRVSLDRDVRGPAMCPSRGTLVFFPSPRKRLSGYRTACCTRVQPSGILLRRNYHLGQHDHGVLLLRRLPATSHVKGSTSGDAFREPAHIWRHLYRCYAPLQTCLPSRWDPCS